MEVFSLCNSDLTGFYAYEGSLTYPDCDEIVQWIVMENPLWTRRDGLVSISIVLPQNRMSLLTDEILLLQLSALRNLLDENGDPLVDNYRPVQAAPANTVYHYTVA